jgi:glucan endo-1,3-beta-D-glucosidase
VAQNKSIWITEAGWPVSGPTENQAVASVENSKTYWDELGCQLFNKYNVWWYILRDNNGSPAPNPSFGIVGLELEEPLFDLTCPAGSSGASETTAAEPAADEPAAAEPATAEPVAAETASSGAASPEGDAADGAVDAADDEDCEERLLKDRN